MTQYRPRTQADAIRTLLDSGVEPAEVRRRLGCSRQALTDAHRARGARGRPPSERECERITITVPTATAAWLRAEADRDGCTLGDVVEGAHLAILAADSGTDPALAKARNSARKDTAV
jgi:transposase-like protein